MPGEKEPDAPAGRVSRSAGVPARIQRKTGAIVETTPGAPASLPALRELSLKEQLRRSPRRTDGAPLR